MATPAYLQRLRRQFIALHRQQTSGLGFGGIGQGGGDLRGNETAISRLFTGFLNDAFGAEF